MWIKIVLILLVVSMVNPDAVNKDTASKDVDTKYPQQGVVHVDIEKNYQ